MEARSSGAKAGTRTPGAVGASVNRRGAFSTVSAGTLEREPLRTRAIRPRRVRGGGAILALPSGEKATATVKAVKRRLARNRPVIRGAALGRVPGGAIVKVTVAISGRTKERFNVATATRLAERRGSSVPRSERDGEPARPDGGGAAKLKA